MVLKSTVTLQSYIRLDQSDIRLTHIELKYVDLIDLDVVFYMHLIRQFNSVRVECDA